MSREAMTNEEAQNILLGLPKRERFLRAIEAIREAVLKRFDAGYSIQFESQTLEDISGAVRRTITITYYE